MLGGWFSATVLLKLAHFHTRASYIVNLLYFITKNLQLSQTATSVYS